MTEFGFTKGTAVSPAYINAKRLESGDVQIILRSDPIRETPGATAQMVVTREDAARIFKGMQQVLSE